MVMDFDGKMEYLKNYLHIYTCTTKKLDREWELASIGGDLIY